MNGWMHHLVIAPIVLPMFVCAVLLAFDERRRTLKRLLSLGTAAALVVIAAALVWEVDAGRSALPGTTGRIATANWAMQMYSVASTVAMRTRSRRMMNGAATAAASAAVCETMVMMAVVSKGRCICRANCCEIKRASGALPK